VTSERGSASIPGRAVRPRTVWRWRFATETISVPVMIRRSSRSEWKRSARWLSAPSLVGDVGDDEYTTELVGSPVLTKSLPSIHSRDSERHVTDSRCVFSTAPEPSRRPGGGRPRNRVVFQSERKRAVLHRSACPPRRLVTRGVVSSARLRGVDRERCPGISMCRCPVPGLLLSTTGVCSPDIRLADSRYAGVMGWPGAEVSRPGPFDVPWCDTASWWPILTAWGSLDEQGGVREWALS
jgi:hypothetical protein